ncbi:MAG: hypothetical protein U9Q34_04140 [Elusimicrobiota bacterium]|nr:hypothetical protein [Elusimicrobiota bacterium]
MNKMIEEKELLQKIFLSSPQAMILFDASGDVMLKNKAAESFPGDALLSSLKDGVKEILESDSAYRNRIVYKYMDDDREKEMSVLINGFVIEHNGGTYALLIIQDISEIMATDGAVNICSNCKKIKRSESSWQEIEAYIQDNLANIQFSHCICPDCSKKLYKGK